MTPVETTDPTRLEAADARTRPSKVRARDIIRSEWIKLWTVRSNWVTLLSAGAVAVLFGIMFSALNDTGADGAGPGPGPATAAANAVDIALGGLTITAMIFGVLGVLVVTGEYSSGMIRTSFAAVGRRLRLVRAKVAVTATSVFAVSAVAVTAAVVAGQAVYSGGLPTVAVTDVIDVILGSTVYLTGIALIGLALGFILRSTAGSISTLVGGVFIGPGLLSLLPDSITDVFMKYLPSEAGSAIMSQVSNPDLLSRGAGYAVFAAWVGGLLVVAAYLVQKRDA